MLKSSVLLVTLFLSILVLAQSREEPCYEILYLDFFGLEDLGELPKWSESEFSGLINQTLAEQEKDSSYNVEFTIPILVANLQAFHPNCVQNADTSYLARTLELYGVTRQFNKNEFEELSLLDQIDFVRDDFYELVQDDANLTEMTFILDDGPFHGVDIDSTGVATESIKTSFGKLEISQLNSVGVLSSIDKNGEVIWRKSITGLGGRELGKISRQVYDMSETSLATIFNLYASGERLTVYVKNDGGFMYYYHSW